MTLRKIDACTYETHDGYRVERMADGTWDAYLPYGWPHLADARIWQTHAHRTRKDALARIRWERNLMKKKIHEILGR